MDIYSITNKIYIDPSHSKANILAIVKQSNLDIIQPYNLTKENLFTTLVSQLENMTYELKFFNPSFPFCDKKEFVDYLGKSNDKLNQYEKQAISMVAKKIISFCKSGYDFNKSPYTSFDEVECDCLKIKQHGDIFCVRTAIKLFNLTKDINNQIDIKLSLTIHNQLQLKNHFKKNCVPSLQIKKGVFLMDFT
tara:strand:+ start:4499 stop:5074 length:576 start_codon:yes stop_codon:yes gene_type:complete